MTNWLKFPFLLHNMYEVTLFADYFSREITLNDASVFEFRHWFEGLEHGIPLIKGSINATNDRKQLDSIKMHFG